MFNRLYTSYSLTQIECFQRFQYFTCYLFMSGSRHIINLPQLYEIIWQLEDVDDIENQVIVQEWLAFPLNA